MSAFLSPSNLQDKTSARLLTPPFHGGAESRRQMREQRDLTSPQMPHGKTHCVSMQPPPQSGVLLFAKQVLQSRMLARSWERKHPLQDVCIKMGSVCERVRLISTRLLAPYRMFWVSRCTDWIVDRYHWHWSLCRGHCRVRSPQSGQSFGKKDYIPHVHFRFRPGTRKWDKILLTATIWAFNIRRFEGAIP